MSEAITDTELEAHISACGDLMLAAYAAGNRQEAEQWMQAQVEAIRGRSLVQVAHMEGCYFENRGCAHRAAMQGTTV